MKRPMDTFALPWCGNIHRLKTGVQVESVWTDRLSIGEIPALAYHAQSASGRRRLAPPVRGSGTHH
jgi:hypothetical protein